MLSLDDKGPGVVTAGQMTEDPQIEIFDPDVHIATLNEEGRAQAAGADQARPRLRLGRPQLRRVDGHRLDPGRLGPQPGPPRQLPRRGGPRRPDDRLRAPDPRGVDQRHGPAGGGGFARRHAAQGPPRHLHPDRGEPAARRRRAGPRGAAPGSTPCWPRTSTSSTSRSARPTRSRTPTSTRSATWCAGPRRTCWRPRTSARSRSKRCRKSSTSSGLSLGMEVPERAAELRRKGEEIMRHAIERQKARTDLLAPGGPVPQPARSRWWRRSGSSPRCPRPRSCGPIAEKVITRGKHGTVHDRRWVLRWVLEPRSGQEGVRRHRAALHRARRAAICASSSWDRARATAPRWRCSSWSSGRMPRRRSR